MKKWRKEWLWILSGLFLWISPLTTEEAAAQTETGRETYIVDAADLLTEEEEQSLTEKAQQLHEKWNQDFVVVTTENAEGKSSEAYADDYYDEHGYGENGVLYLVDLDNGNVWISTTGAAIRFLTDERIEVVINAGYEWIKGQEYETGFLRMLEQTDQYMDKGIPDHQYTYNTETGEIIRHRSVTGMEALVAVGLALICGGGFAVFIHGSYKMKKSDYTYPFMEKGKVDYVRKEDRFINEIVTHRRIPKNPPSDGGGSGRSSVHTSSSGSTHGGGGRSL